MPVIPAWRMWGRRMNRSSSYFTYVSKFKPRLLRDPSQKAKMNTLTKPEWSAVPLPHPGNGGIPQEFLSHLTWKTNNLPFLIASLGTSKISLLSGLSSCIRFIVKSFCDSLILY